MARPSSPPSSPIPAFYRILFTIIDPLFCLLGFALHIFDPTNTLLGYSPSARVNPAPVESQHLLDSMAGFFLTLGLIEAVLLRVKSTDRDVWRIVQGSASMLDILMVFGAVRALSAEGRLDVGVWRGDDYRLVVGNAVAGVARLACAAGVGMGVNGKAKKG